MMIVELEEEAKAVDAEGVEREIQVTVHRSTRVAARTLEVMIVVRWKGAEVKRTLQTAK